MAEYIYTDEKPAAGHFLGNIIKGMIVGTGAILPGVSGGLLCAAFGIYEPLMLVLSNPKKHLKTHLRLMIPFITGWVLGFILLAGAAEKFFEISPGGAVMLFGGLIAGTIPQMLRDAETDGKSSWSYMILTFLLFTVLFDLMQSGSTAVLTPGISAYIFCGLIWGLSLIIPGLSSSSLLIMTGLYQPMTAGIASLDFSVLLPLGLGTAVTVILFSRAAAAMFEKHRGIILKMIAGIMLASVVCMKPEFSGSLSGVFVSVLCFAAGYVISVMMDRKQQN